MLWHAESRPHKSVARSYQCAPKMHGVFKSVITLPGAEFLCYEHLKAIGAADASTRFTFVERDWHCQDAIADYLDMWEFDAKPLVFFGELSEFRPLKFGQFRPPRKFVDLANLDLCCTPSADIFRWITLQLRPLLVAGSVVNLTMCRNRRSSQFARRLWSLEGYPFLRAELDLTRRLISAASAVGKIDAATVHRRAPSVKSLLLVAALLSSLPGLRLRPDCCLEYGDGGCAMTALRFTVLSAKTGTPSTSKVLQDLVLTARDRPAHLVTKLKYYRELSNTMSRRSGAKV